MYKWPREVQTHVVQESTVFSPYFVINILFYFILFYFIFLGPHLQPMEVPRLRFKSECSSATAMPVLSHICNPHHSSQQRWILNPLSEAKDQTSNLMVPSWIRFHCTMTGSPIMNVLVCIYTYTEQISLGFVCFLFFVFSFLWTHPRHMAVPTLRIKSELQPPAYITALETPDPSHIFNLHCSL